MPRILAKADTFCLLSGPGAALAELFNCVEEVQFWIKDRAGRYLAMNGACLLNYSLVSFTEAAGRTDFDFSPP